MTPYLLVIAWLLPLSLALLPLRRPSAWAPVVAPLGAFTVALWLEPGDRVTLDWLLLGSELALDRIGFWFLLASALVWLFAAVQRALAVDGPRAGALGQRLFLLTMAGNFLLIVAADGLTFYLGFALMGLSAYGLIIGRRSQRARYAGRVYLVWTLIGELALFLALVLSAAQARSLGFADLAAISLPDVAVALLLLGFGIKLAVPGLHFWMPVAYGAAPATAVAVLAGPLFSAGLFGLLRFLPPGQPAVAGWATPLLGAGVLALVYATLAGLLTSRPRRVLGYSSMLKSGTLLIVLALAWRHPQAAPVVSAALVLFTVHHLVLKGGLFLGLGLGEKNGLSTAVLGGLLLLALGLVGAPLTAGAPLKQDLTEALAAAGGGWGWVLSAAAVGSVLLMLNFFRLLGRARTDIRAPVMPLSLWWLLVLCGWWFPAGLGGWSAQGPALSVLALGLILAGAARLAMRMAGPVKAPRRWSVRPLRRLMAVLRFSPSSGGWSLPSPPDHWLRVPVAEPDPGLAGQAWLSLLLGLLLSLVLFR
jgi:hydrogenase-4 component B